MTKLCPRGKAAAKRKFKVYPSAYANAYASKICAGKIKDPSGVKRKDFKGKKPSSSKVASAAKRVRRANIGGEMKLKKKPQGAVLGLLGTAALMNMMKKRGKKAGRAQAQQGQQVNPVTGEGTEQPGMDNTNEKMMAAVKNMNKFGAFSTGDIVNTPSATGSYIKQDIDGDESFVNQSAIDYYKGMLD